MFTFTTGTKAPAQRRIVRICPSSRRCSLLKGVGKDVVGGSGWLDLASLVSGGGQTKGIYSDLAYKIGATA
jgi:hypothetical protein